MDDQVQATVRHSLHQLRNKILDLSRRNLLISAKVSGRGSTAIRVVDEVPDLLVPALLDGKKYQLIPLPALDQEPQDEHTTNFRMAFARAKLTDSRYAQALESIDPSSDHFEDEKSKAERALRDRLRHELGLPPREKQGSISLDKHARNHGISPSYNLPSKAQKSTDGRHEDNKIQTLLLPDQLRAQADKILKKSKSWSDETGLSNLYMAIGFVEWTDPSAQQKIFSPLLLAEIELEKETTPKGPKYRISTSETQLKQNVALQKKLESDFGIKLPDYKDGQSIESFFEGIQKAPPPSLEWSVKSQVAIGVFPSAGISMYNDLDPDAKDFAANELVEKMLAFSTDRDGLRPETDREEDYEEDVETPKLVLPADASQISAIKEINQGSNLAVEGPPGSGKSQTIVNVIAESLRQGKKVLFVAEKLAALEVVESRLEALGLKEFSLRIHSDGSSRKAIAESLHKRLSKKKVKQHYSPEAERERLRAAKTTLDGYARIQGLQVMNTGLTVHAVLGEAIRRKEVYDALPKNLRAHSLSDLTRLNPSRLESAVTSFKAYEDAYASIDDPKSVWSALQTPVITPSDRTKVADSLSHFLTILGTLQQELRTTRANLGIAGPNEEALLNAYKTLSQIKGLGDQSHRFLQTLLQEPNPKRMAEDFRNHLQWVSEIGELRTYLASTLIDPFAPETYTKIANWLKRQDEEVVQSFGSLPDLPAEITKTEESLRRFTDARERLDASVELLQLPTETPTAAVRTIKRLYTSLEGVLMDKRTAMADSSLERTFLEEHLKLIEESEALHAELDDKFKVDAALEEFNPAEARARLKQSGRFASFSKDYRATRKQYRSLLRGNHPKFKYAYSFLDKLQRLIELRQSIGERNDRLQREIGIRPTRAPEVESLLKTYDYTQKAIHSFQGLKQEVRSACIRVALHFPKTEVAAVEPPPQEFERYTTVDLSNSIDSRRERTAILKGILATLRDLRGLFHGEELPKLSELEDLKASLERFAELDSSIKGNERVASFLRRIGHEPTGAKPDAFEREIEIGLQVHEQDTPDELMTGIVVSDAFPAELPKIKAIAVRLSQFHEEVLEFQATYGEDLVPITNSLTDTAAKVEELRKDHRGFTDFSKLATARQSIVREGFGKTIECFEDSGSSASAVVDPFQAILYHNLANWVYEEHSAVLSTVTGQILGDTQAELRRIDDRIREINRDELINQLLLTAEPPDGIGRGRRSEWTEMHLVNNETYKQRRFVAPRDLLSRSRTAILELKPCWMMSPLSVAQYLSTKEEIFDLCIIDEASQMPPENALGALLRSKRSMIVGDTNQLPPSTFFKKMVVEDEDEASEDIYLESILERANALFHPKHRLRWHYRSKSSSLIRFSNFHIYNQKLQIFPSPGEQVDSNLGVYLHQVDGEYKSGTNAEEAKTMVDAILQFMTDSRDRSLGVVLLNKKQAELVEEELEAVRMTDQRIDRYVDEWASRNGGLESFFIKNLENVQGDERDVIFIGTVYGPANVGGRVAQRFGPISGQNGRRRLNVLFTRAKQRIETFSSMTPADILHDSDNPDGKYLLKKWLEYSQNGIIESGTNPHEEPDSPFEEYVGEQIKDFGFLIDYQVGVNKFRIDIGVRHPSYPHGYLVGVECDGASYHSSRSARDRDKLRHEILEGLGWTLHRIWSTDWFNDPIHEGERLRIVLEKRLAALTA
jgi:very-short-patch-repair endonuclease